MISKSKAYIPWPLAIIIKWCQMTKAGVNTTGNREGQLKIDRNKRLPAVKQYANSQAMDGWKNEIKHDGWWLMKMKIVLQNQTTITANKFCKYNDRSRVTAIQTYTQTQRHRNWWTFRQENKKTYLHIDTQADLQGTHAHREVNKTLKMGSYVLLFLNK